MFKIITDSCVNLPAAFLQEHDIATVNLHLQVDGENYTPGEDIDIDTALSKIAVAKEMPKTSQPTPHAYQEAFRQAAADHEGVMCFTVSTKMSGSFNSANLAAQGAEKPVYVHDTLLGSFGQGFQVMLAALMQEKGHTLEQIKQSLQEFYQQCSIVAILEKYDNAIKGGRMNKYAGKIIEKLNIRGIIEVIDGQVTVVDKARGADKTFQKTLERISSKAPDFSQMVIGISHFQNPELAEKYREALDNLLHPSNILMDLLSPAIGVYTDKGGVVISIAPDPYCFVG